MDTVKLIATIDSIRKLRDGNSKITIEVPLNMSQEVATLIADCNSNKCYAVAIMELEQPTDDLSKLIT